jgi:uncharacterized protein YeaO (DUF488 family)
MPEEVRMWEILGGEDLREIRRVRLDLESRIEGWLARDISIISDDLLVVGRQVQTIFGGIIDLLCLDSQGDVTIVELKRDKTPREITAQTLDYASWVKDLSNEKITEIANTYLGDRGPLEEAFRKRFDTELPEVVNENHKMMIVASELDSSSERIIRYLSDSYGVGINVATFGYFRNQNGQELLARVFLIEPEQVEYKSQTKSTSKRKPLLTHEELREIAHHNGVEEIYTKLVEGLQNLFDQTGTTRSSVTFKGHRQNTILSLIPGESNGSSGLRFQVYSTRLAEYLGISEQDAISLLPEHREEWEYYRGAPPEWSGFAGYFEDLDAAHRFLATISKAGK